MSRYGRFEAPSAQADRAFEPQIARPSAPPSGYDPAYNKYANVTPQVAAYPGRPSSTPLQGFRRPASEPVYGAPMYAPPEEFEDPYEAQEYGREAPSQQQQGYPPPPRAVRYDSSLYAPGQMASQAQQYSPYGNSPSNSFGPPTPSPSVQQYPGPPQMPQGQQSPYPGLAASQWSGGAPQQATLQPTYRQPSYGQSAQGSYFPPNMPTNLPPTPSPTPPQNASPYSPPPNPSPYGVHGAQHQYPSPPPSTVATMQMQQQASFMAPAEQQYHVSQQQYYQPTASAPPSAPPQNPYVRPPSLSFSPTPAPLQQFIGSDGRPYYASPPPMMGAPSPQSAPQWNPQPVAFAPPAEPNVWPGYQSAPTPAPQLQTALPNAPTAPSFVGVGYPSVAQQQQPPIPAVTYQNPQQQQQMGAMAPTQTQIGATAPTQNGVFQPSAQNGVFQPPGPDYVAVSQMDAQGRAQLVWMRKKDVGDPTPTMPPQEVPGANKGLTPGNWKPDRWVFTPEAEPAQPVVATPSLAPSPASAMVMHAPVAQGQPQSMMPILPPTPAPGSQPQTMAYQTQAQLLQQHASLPTSTTAYQQPVAPISAPYVPPAVPTQPVQSAVQPAPAPGPVPPAATTAPTSTPAASTAPTSTPVSTDQTDDVGADDVDPPAVKSKPSKSSSKASAPPPPAEDAEPSGDEKENDGGHSSEEEEAKTKKKNKSRKSSRKDDEDSGYDDEGKGSERRSKSRDRDRTSDDKDRRSRKGKHHHHHHHKKSYNDDDDDRDYDNDRASRRRDKRSSRSRSRSRKDDDYRSIEKVAPSRRDYSAYNYPDDEVPASPPSREARSKPKPRPISRYDPNYDPYQDENTVPVYDEPLEDRRDSRRHSRREEPVDYRSNTIDRDSKPVTGYQPAPPKAASPAYNTRSKSPSPPSKQKSKGMFDKLLSRAGGNGVKASPQDDEAYTSNYRPPPDDHYDEYGAQGDPPPRPPMPSRPSMKPEKASWIAGWTQDVQPTPGGYDENDTPPLPARPPLKSALKSSGGKGQSMNSIPKPSGAPRREVHSLDDVIDEFTPETAGLHASQLYGAWASSAPPPKYR